MKILYSLKDFKAAGCVKAVNDLPIESLLEVISLCGMELIIENGKITGYFC